jgi:hypothetical protein
MSACNTWLPLKLDRNMKTIFATSAAIGLSLALAGGAHAASHAKACEEETVAMVMEQVEAAPADKKAMAMEEFAMAKEKMEAGMTDDCSGHLTKASELSAN